MSRNLKDIINNEAKQYAIYTIENRAIANMMDGLKPVQRFILYRTLDLGKSNKSKFHKLASVAGGVADIGYHHGENSAQDAGALMANTWNNNYPLLDGSGNFGSRLVQQAAASRYIYCRTSENFFKTFKDFNVCPEHNDPEHIPPKFYLPIIPTILLNGVRGIGTGYATNILPHSYESVLECTQLALQGTLDKNPSVQYPKFKGLITNNDNAYELHGLYEWKSKTVFEITEIPYQWDRTKYISKILDELESKGFITYEDMCDKNGFGFKIKIRKDYVLPTDDTAKHNKIMKDFGLIEKLQQNIVVLDQNGKLKEYTCAKDLIIDFVEIRKEYVRKRIDFMINESIEKYNKARAKALFIKFVIDGSITVSKVTKQNLIDQINNHSLLSKANTNGVYTNDMINMSIYRITKDEYSKLTQEAKLLKADYDYWKNTDVITEYTNDLK